MNRRQGREITSENAPEFQAMLEAMAEPWALDHQNEPGSGITYVPPNLEEYPEQSVTEFITPARPLPNYPEKIIMLGIRAKIGESIGGSALKGWFAAGNMIKDFKTKPAFADRPDGPSIAEQVLLDVDSGKNLAIVPAHQDRTDIAKLMGALTAATGRSSLIAKNNFIPINPVMKFEDYRGNYMPRFINPTGNISWIIPMSPGAAKRNIPRKLLLAFNGSSAARMGNILKDKNHGTITSVALTQAGMLAKVDSATGKLKRLEFPEMFDTAASALRLTDRALPMAYFTDPQTGKPKWELGSFINRSSVGGESESDTDLLFLHEIMLDLQARMQKIAKVPVQYLAFQKTSDILASRVATVQTA